MAVFNLIFNVILNKEKSTILNYYHEFQCSYLLCNASFKRKYVDAVHSELPKLQKNSYIVAHTHTY